MSEIKTRKNVYTGVNYVLLNYFDSRGSLCLTYCRSILSIRVLWNDDW
jgi:hypothetical protein